MKEITQEFINQFNDKEWKEIEKTFFNTVKENNIVLEWLERSQLEFFIKNRNLPLITDMIKNISRKYYVKTEKLTKDTLNKINLLTNKNN